MSERLRWRIKEFASIVGVSETTLRAWERRYGLVKPERSDGGFRLYSRADERRVRAMLAHMARGLAAAQAADLAQAESSVATVAPSQTANLVDALVDAAAAYDATRFDALLEAAFTLGRLGGIRDIVLPALAEIGDRWERGELSVGQEHFASHLVERRLLAVAQGWEAGTGPLGLLACLSGERHTLGLVCFGLVLADQGWRIAYLGADTPVEQVLTVSASVRPEAVILCSRDAQRLTANSEAITLLGASHRTLLGGDGASAELAAQLGVTLAAGGPVNSALALAACVPQPTPAGRERRTRSALTRRQ